MEHKYYYSSITYYYLITTNQKRGQDEKTTKKIYWNRLLKKALEDGIKKAIELLILAIAAGVAFKLIMITVPAVTLGAVVAKIVKIRFLDY